MKRSISILLIAALVVTIFAGYTKAEPVEAAEKTISITAFNKLFKKSIKDKEAQKMLLPNSSKAITRLEAA